METTLLVGSTAELAAAVLFAFTGRKTAARRVSADARVPNAGLTAWWMSIALLWLIDAARGYAVAARGPTDRFVHDAFVALFYIAVLVLCVALWGLLNYLVFLYRGRHATAPLGIFYGAYFLVASVAVAAARPDEIRLGAWATHVTYDVPLAPGVEASLFLFLLAPQLAGAAAYLSLARRASDPMQRYRIVVVGTTLLVWIGVNLAADLLRITYDDAWQIARIALGILAATAILSAYAPPSWLRRRFGPTLEAA